MVSPGNHEMHYLGIPYLYRFAMPGKPIVFGLSNGQTRTFLFSLHSIVYTVSGPERR